MYYFNNMNPYISQLLGELNFWISLSREHPLFIKEIAGCEHIPLDSSLKKRLNKNFKDFKGLHQNITILRDELSASLGYSPFQNNPSLLLEVSANLHNIIKVNMDFLDILQKLGYIHSENRTWRVFINHLSLEQKHFLEVCSSYSTQLKSMGY